MINAVIAAAAAITPQNTFIFLLSFNLYGGCLTRRVCSFVVITIYHPGSLDSIFKDALFCSVYDIFRDCVIYATHPNESVEKRATKKTILSDRLSFFTILSLICFIYKESADLACGKDVAGVSVLIGIKRLDGIREFRESAS